MSHRQLCFHRAQGTSPAATLARVQGSRHFSTSHVSLWLHPHCTARPSPCISIKGDVQGLPKGDGTGRQTQGEDEQRQTE
jgi:hypothetical protein